MPSLFDLSGRNAVVIGGTSGIGRQLAIGLAEHGANVVPVGRNVQAVQTTCESIEALGRRSLSLSADVNDRKSLATLAQNVSASFGSIDILVNAAGVTRKEPTIEVSDVEWARILETNLNGMLRACQIFHSPLKQCLRGRIINIASLGSYVAFHEVAAYCASKSAVLSLTRSLACEWAPDGICVNAIAPGVFPTDLNKQLLHGTERGKEILMRTPMKRFGRTEELVGAAVYLASDGASFTTGHCLVVDGGYLASGVNS